MSRNHLNHPNLHGEFDGSTILDRQQHFVELGDSGEDSSTIGGFFVDGTSLPLVEEENWGIEASIPAPVASLLDMPVDRYDIVGGKLKLGPLGLNANISQSPSDETVTACLGAGLFGHLDSCVDIGWDDWPPTVSNYEYNTSAQAGVGAEFELLGVPIGLNADVVYDEGSITGSANADTPLFGIGSHVSVPISFGNPLNELAELHSYAENYLRWIYFGRYLK